MALLKAGVEKKTIECINLKSSSNEYFSVSTYSLRKRVTTDSLLTEFAKKVSSAEKIFNEMIGDANLFLLSNYHGAKAMDKDLASEYESSPQQNDSIFETPQEEVLRQKDGTRRLECPFFHCCVKSFRLKRHLIDSHADLSTTQVSLAMKMAMIIARNKERPDNVYQRPVVGMVKKTKDMKGDHRTNMASRKYNLKRCELCKSLQFNLTSHLKSTHKMTRITHPEQYDALIKDSEVIPKCYTRKINNRHVMLEGEDLSMAMRENESTVEEHSEVNRNLKALRDTRDELFRKKNMEMDSAERGRLDVEWKRADELYKALRYKDTRVYSERILVWKNSFKDYVTRRAYSNPTRYVNMALDVVLSYEGNLNFSQLSDPKIIRKMLQGFKEKPNVTSTSKLKYLGMFRSFVKFIFLDIDSPECEVSLSSSQMTRREYMLKLVEHEIESMVQILTKDKGSDLILTKKKATKKLIQKKDIEMLRDSISKSLCSKLNLLSNLIKNGTLESKMEMAIKVRDELIAIATVRLCRRSKELIKLSIEEVNKASLRYLPNGSSYYMIEVQDHKNTRTGVPATIAYTQCEFKILNLFIKHFRTVLTNGEETSIVFPNRIKPSNPNVELSFTDLHYILSKFKTSSGISISSRSIRGSAVTNFQREENCDKTRRDMAVSMGHTLAVQQRNYNYEKTTDACARVLNETIEHSAMDPTASELCDSELVNFSDISLLSPAQLLEEVCTPQRLNSDSNSDSLHITTLLTANRSQTSNSNNHADPSFSNSTTFDDRSNSKVYDYRAGPSSSSTPLKCRKRASTDSPHDITLQNLRNKKVKSAMSLNQLTDEIITAIGKMDDEAKCRLFTKKGNMSIKPLKKLLPNHVFENFTIKEIKKQIGIIELHRVLTE